MLEGLEVTIKQFSELSNSDDETLRFDAEHYQHHYLAMVNQLQLHQHAKVLDLIRKPVITGHTPSMKVDRYYDGNIAFIKTDNLRENQIVGSYTDYLTEAGDDELKSSRLKLNDILVTIIGATHAIVGRCAIVRQEHLPANINQNIALIEADDTKINPNYLNIYLNSKFGRGMLHFHSRQTEQVNLNCREVERVLVPLFPKLESLVSDLSNQSSKLKAKSKELYAQAEKTLLEAVGLADFKPSTQNTNIKTFAQSFGASGRLDAEYYQPKYEEVANVIKQYGFDALDNFIENYSTGYPYSSDTYIDNGLPLIRINNIKNGSLDIADCAYIPDADVALSPKDLALENDILISMSGSIGNSCKIPNGLKAVVNQRIMRITPKGYDVDVLPIVINSIIGKSQLERIGTGGVQTNISACDIQQIFIPTLDLATQTNISQLVQQSFTLKAESERLLNVAKRAVEIAIEQDEAVGLAYIAS